MAFTEVDMTEGKGWEGGCRVLSDGTWAAECPGLQLETRGPGREAPRKWMGLAGRAESSQRGAQPWALRSGVGGGSGEAESEGRVSGVKQHTGRPRPPRREKGPVHPR